MTRSNGGETDRGSITPKAALALILGLAITAMITAFLLPVGVTEIAGDTSSTITQDVGEEVEVNPALNATLDSTVDGTNATYTLNTSSGDSETNTIAVGSETTYSTLSEGNVTVNVSAASATDATATFTYSPDYAWGDGASALWSILDVIIILAVFLFIVAMAMAAMKKT